ncbi:hypothetical protein DF048_11610 [Burkholderia seminalis]|nr:hypothetical protein DF048_11610 [Burkholderia seminalis]
MRSVRCITRRNTPMRIDVPASPAPCRVDLREVHSSTRHFTSSRIISPQRIDSRISSPLNLGEACGVPPSRHASHSPRSDSPG